MSELIDGFAVQRRILAALIIRELQGRYGRENIGFLWIMVEPLMFASGVMALWVLIHGPYNRDLPVVPFVLLGYIPLLMFRHAVSISLSCIGNSAGLLYHRHVAVVDLFFARIIPEFAGNILAFVTSFTFLWALGQVEWPHDSARLLLGYFLMMWYTMGVASVLTVLNYRFEIVDKIWTPVSYLMIPLSGAYLAASWLPSSVQPYYLLIPSVSAYELMRSGYFGDGFVSYWNIPYLVAFSALTTLWGLWLLHGARRHVIVE